MLHSFIIGHVPHFCELYIGLTTEYPLIMPSALGERANPQFFYRIHKLIFLVEIPKLVFKLPFIP